MIKEFLKLWRDWVGWKLSGNNQSIEFVWTGSEGMSWGKSWSGSCLDGGEVVGESDVNHVDGKGWAREGEAFTGGEINFREGADDIDWTGLVKVLVMRNK